MLSKAETAHACILAALVCVICFNRAFCFCGSCGQSCSPCCCPDACSTTQLISRYFRRMVMLQQTSTNALSSKAKCSHIPDLLLHIVWSYLSCANDRVAELLLQRPLLYSTPCLNCMQAPLAASAHQLTVGVSCRSATAARAVASNAACHAASS